MEQYRNRMLFGFLLFTLANGVLSELTCSKKIEKCSTEALVAAGGSEKDIIESLDGDFVTMLKKMAELDTCKYIKSFRKCHGQIDIHCETEIGEQMKTTLDFINIAEAQFQCGNPKAEECVRLMNKCGIDAMASSGITREDLAKIKPPALPVTNPFEVLAQLGADKACKYFKSVLNCFDGSKERCAAVTFVQTSLSQLEKSMAKLQC